MDSSKTQDRRSFVINALSVLPVVALLGNAPSEAAQHPQAKSANADKEKGEEKEITPTEDLMQEHGALNRVLLIYDEVIRRLRAGTMVEPELVISSASFIHDFIENYHEKQEEQDIFPRMEKANKLTDLVATLRQQHDAGRQVTTRILQEAKQISSTNKTAQTELAGLLEAFNRMYRPHEAREDSVLFPAFRDIVSEHELKELGEKFEDREHEMFGKNGYEKNVEKIAEIEKRLGIYDLKQFTPHLV